MVFTLPNVEVGSIIEYKLQIRYDDEWISSPEWTIQQPYFVHKAHYFFQPSQRWWHGVMWASHVKPGTKVVTDSQGRYTYDVEDVPAVPNEDWMPPLNSLNMRVQFYYAEYHDGQEYWREQGKAWAKGTEKFADADKAIKGAVGELVGASDTEEQKAKKLYDAVMKLENTDFTRQKSSEERKKEKIKEIKRAEDVWIQKSGGSDELALLYVAMARAAGLQVVPMQVVNRDRAIFDPDYLHLGQLDDYIAVIDPQRQGSCISIPGRRCALWPAALEAYLCCRAARERQGSRDCNDSGQHVHAEFGATDRRPGGGPGRQREAEPCASS